MSAHDPLCPWRPDIPQPDGSTISWICQCDAVAKGRRDGILQALAVTDKGGRAEAKIRALLDGVA